MKYCIDCENFADPKCNRPIDTGITSLVYGTTSSPLGRIAELERNDGSKDACGRKGKFWKKLK